MVCSTQVTITKQIFLIYACGLSASNLSVISSQTCVNNRLQSGLQQEIKHHELHFLVMGNSQMAHLDRTLILKEFHQNFHPYILITTQLLYCRLG